MSLWVFGSCPENSRATEKWNFHCKCLAGEKHVDVAPALFLFIGKREIKEQKTGH